MSTKQIITPEDRMVSMSQEIFETLSVCAKTFEFYEQHHRAKNTPEANAKADVNRALADSVRALIVRIHGGPQ